MKIINGIIALIIGIFTIFKHSFKKRVTMEYPEVKPVLFERFRGRPEWCGDSCIACKICEKVCPSGAIKIEKQDDNINFKLDLSKCIICGNCAYYCPKNAMCLSHYYELASDNKNDLFIENNSKDIKNE